MAPGGAWDGYISASGAIGYHPESGKMALSVVTYFGNRKALLTCGGESSPLATRDERQKNQGAAVAVFEYWTWMERTMLERCIERPLTLTVDGRAYRLDTKLLRRAAEKAVARAG